MAKRRNGYPRTIEKWYAREINRFIFKWKKQANLAVAMIKPYVLGGTKMLQDADNSNNPNWVHYVQEVLNLMSTSIDNVQSTQELNSLASRYVYSVDSFSANKVKHKTGTVQVKASTIAINPLENNTKLQEYAQAKIIENVSLINKLKETYKQQLQSDIYRLISNGSGITDLSHNISSRTGMALRHATLIANDQTGTILSQIDTYRNKKAGAEKYIWRSMEDGRVRPKHQELDGEVFEYDDPDGGDDGQLPGEPINCRCYADAVF